MGQRDVPLWFVNDVVIGTCITCYGSVNLILSEVGCMH